MAKPEPQRKQSIESLKARMERDPFSRAFLQLSEEYRKAGRFEEATRVCMEGLSRHPAYHTARIALGRTYLESGNLEQARDSFAEVIEAMPENHVAGKLLADVQSRLGDPAGAAATYRAMLEHYPGDHEIQALLDGVLEEIEPGSTVEEASPGPEERSTPPSGVMDTTPLPATETQEASGSKAAVPPGRGSQVPAAETDDRHEEIRSSDRPEPMSSPGLAGAERGSKVGAPELSWSGPEQEDGDEIQTNTLAELYLRQGLIQKALEVYQGMLVVDPDNERARRRLEELSGEDRPAAPQVVDSIPEREETEILIEPEEPQAVSEGAVPAASVSEEESRARAIRRLERWLADIRSGSGGPEEVGPR